MDIEKRYYGNEMWLVRSTTKAKALPARDGHTGRRKVKCEPIAQILDNMSGYPVFNGYWRVPQSVITKEPFN